MLAMSRVYKAAQENGCGPTSWRRGIKGESMIG